MRRTKATAIFLGLTALLLFGVRSCVNSEWYVAHQAEQAAEDAAAQTPHVVREADGCRVYAFERYGREHYFTRCGATVTTESTYSVPCGKSCTSTKTESIVTEGNR